jgi:hypothetical protein
LSNFVVEESIMCFIIARLGIMHVKNDIISYNQEVEMFHLEMTSINMAFGVNYHFVYFCSTKFLIRVGVEMKNINDSDFFTQ